MRIERVLYPVETLGPGKRLTIWVNGCSKACCNCISPEMQMPNNAKDIPLKKLVSLAENIIKENNVSGITISGGDPLEQSRELLKLTNSLHRFCRDILIYTGYSLDEVRSVLTTDEYLCLTNTVAVLIDGRYIDALNDNVSPLTGSTNQTIHIFDESLRNIYGEYLGIAKRQVQNIYYGDKMVSVGIHRKEVM